MPSKPTTIVLTGGPCAGKTTLVDLVERSFSKKLVSLPEAATLLYSGGFPRFSPPEAMRAAQRAIFRVQHELEAAYLAQHSERALVMDRGTVDGAAYWPDGEDAFFQSFGTTLEKEFQRYSSVIYLESAAEEDYLRHQDKNPSRTENWAEAKKLDVKTLQLWQRHPKFTLVASNRSFESKIQEVLALISASITG